MGWVAIGYAAVTNITSLIKATAIVKKDRKPTLPPATWHASSYTEPLTTKDGLGFDVSISMV